MGEHADELEPGKRLDHGHDIEGLIRVAGEARPAEAEAFGQIALQKGYVTPSQLDRALTKQKETSGALKLGQILLRNNWLTTSQFLEILHEQSIHPVPSLNRIGKYEILDLLGAGGMGIV